LEIAKTYTPSEIEDKWYERWMEKGFFHSEPDDREPFTIVIPPPNVTGVLHLGHALNNTVQDILIRRARMQGKNACWVPGTDHASIATEAKVVAMLRERGIEKKGLSREEFLKYVWEWKEKYGGIILQQLKKLGASCDWERVAFTMDEDYYKAVIKVFIDLHNKGLIYRGTRMVNWDPKAQTALSDEEVNFKEVNSRLFYIQYEIQDSNTPNSLGGGYNSIPEPSNPKSEIRNPKSITIATTRPETVLGDTAICVHPEDERYKKLIGKTAIVPLIGRSIPIIADEYVDKEFGTGALKVTPAHDKNDYELGKKHKLQSIDVFNPDGTISAAAQLYTGKDRFEARKLIVKELEEKGHLIKIEDIKNNVGYSERTDVVIEPRLSQQWFLKMKELAAPALQAVESNDIKFHPVKYKNLYRHWMEGIHDWCISRQLWWGQRIPAWYNESGDYVVAATAEEAIKLFQIQNPNTEISNIKQDEDVLDTWFSSWLWPEEVFKGVTDPGNAEMAYYYPTQVLVTAPEIIFFWVARMIMAGFEYENSKPFKHVYFTGIVRDKQGRKMSKSLGNSPDMLELIEKFGADSVRFGVLISSPAGNDLLYDEKQVEQGRNFSNKIWNAMRLVKGWEERIDTSASSDEDKQAIEWFENRYNQVFAEIETYYKDFRVSDILTSIYKLIWDDFCAWYLELIKPSKDDLIAKITFDATIIFFERLMKLLHPFMPFVTEEIWHLLKERGENEFCINSQYPELKAVNNNLTTEAEKIFDLIMKIRAFRSEHNMSPKEAIELHIRSDNPKSYKSWEGKINRMANISSFQYIDMRIEGAKQIVIKSDEIYIPHTKELNIDEEKGRIEKELEYARGFLNSVNIKLSNERFVQNARPELLEKENAKKHDAESKIRALEESLNKLN
jgi:valyl-tRNA synthetase